MTERKRLREEGLQWQRCRVRSVSHQFIFQSTCATLGRKGFQGGSKMVFLNVLPAQMCLVVVRRNNIHLNM